MFWRWIDTTSPRALDYRIGASVVALNQYLCSYRNDRSHTSVCIGARGPTSIPSGPLTNNYVGGAKRLLLPPARHAHLALACDWCTRAPTLWIIMTAPQAVRTICKDNRCARGRQLLCATQCAQLGLDVC